MGELSRQEQRLKSINDSPHVSLPPWAGRVTIFSEKGKRRAKCFACGDDIPKNTMRVGFLSFSFRRQKFRNGGSSSHVTVFAHPNCIRGIVKGTAVDRRHIMNCLDCGNKTTAREASRASLRPGGEWGWICDTCLQSGRFAKCANCKVHLPQRVCSLALNPKEVGSFDYKEPELAPTSHVAPAIVCDGCSLSFNIATFRSISRQETADNRFSQHLQRAVEQTVDWLGESSADRSGPTGQHTRQG